MSGIREAERVIDARGKHCPAPLMDLIKAIKGEKPGSVLILLSSDSNSLKDIPEWVKKAGHELIDVIRETDHWKIVIRKLK